MGQSTNGQISFGVVFPEEHRFPWDSDEDEGDFEAWWRKVNGYKDPVPLDQLYTPEGEYLPGVEGDKAAEEAHTNLCRKNYRARDAWDKEHPRPAELVNACSGDVPMMIVSVPGSETCANRGYTVVTKPEEIFKSVTLDQKNELDSFIQKYLVVDEMELEPAHWYLSSYWG